MGRLLREEGPRDTFKTAALALNYKHSTGAVSRQKDSRTEETTMKKSTILVAVLMAAAGSAYAADFSDLQTLRASDVKNIPAALGEVARGYVGPVEPVDSATPIDWVSIPGGKFTMGTTSTEQDFVNAKPVREVAIKTFEMAKTAVTVEQYAECVSKGLCTEPAASALHCNWGKPGRQLHPVNCVDWNQAQAYARFKSARLPTEAEWEYAATSGGRNQKYPWGNDEPTCDKAVMNGNGGYGCGTNSTMPVCSKPKGNTAQGGSKVVTLETGGEISVPLFVNGGDIIRINTETKEYVERVGK